MRRSLMSLAVGAALAAPLCAQELVPPPDWTWVVDRPAQLVNMQFDRELPDSEFRFVMMPPGFHVTTGPGLNLFHPSNQASGIFTLESEFFLFPNSTDNEYGLFVGGRDLDGDGRAFTAFVARRDGSVAVLRYVGDTVTPVVPWKRHEAVTLVQGQEPAKNVIRVAAEQAAVLLIVNGAEVARVSRDRIPVTGLFGFRVGARVNLHVTTLDHTRRLAPPRPLPQP